MKRNLKRKSTALITSAIMVASSFVWTPPMVVNAEIATVTDANVAANEIGSVPIDSNNFPDDNFRAYIMSEIDDGDGVLSAEEITNVEEIDVAGKNISSLQGIEYFTSLMMLFCQGNRLTSLDISENTKLETLWCMGNDLSSLDVGNNTQLIQFYCADNCLKDLDISKNINLLDLVCCDNALKSLDVSRNTQLVKLTCYNNNIGSLDLSNNTALRELYCSDNNIDSLDLSNNIQLIEVSCGNNNMRKLDVSNCAQLMKLYCSENKLSSLDVGNSTQLIQLYCYINNLSDLDVSSCTQLIELGCYSNNLSELNTKNNSQLSLLWCSSNNISDLDLSYNKQLVELTCHNNSLSKINVSNNLQLEILSCSGNDIEELNVTNNTNLVELSCSQMKINNLDVSNNKKLKKLECAYNNLNNLDVSNNIELTSLWCIEDGLSELDVSKNIKLDFLACSLNDLSRLDVSNNKLLTTLWCGENKLEEIDVSKNIELAQLDCHTNKLSSLDIDKNYKLEYLVCCSNNIGNLDVSNNTQLKSLNCQDNPLNKIDISKNTKLDYFMCDENTLKGVSFGKTDEVLNIHVETSFNFKNKYDLSVFPWLDINELEIKEMAIYNDGEYEKDEQSYVKDGVFNVVDSERGYIKFGYDNKDITIYYMDTGNKIPGTNAIPVQSICVTPEQLKLTVGEESKVEATVMPVDASNKSVNWSSDNAMVATVDENGKITALNPGTAIITAYANDGSGVNASCQITVELKEVKVEEITLNKTSLTLVECDSETLTETVAPSNATNKAITWTTSNANVATVDANGKVTAVSPGSAVITVAPSNATNKEVTWTTSNESIVTVDANGKLTAVKPGSAVITATAKDGSGVKASCTVNVSKKQEPTTEAPTTEAPTTEEPIKAPTSAGIYINSMTKDGIVAGLVVDVEDKSGLEFSWYATADDGKHWFKIQDWKRGNEWLNWVPDNYGDYIIVGKVRVINDESTALQDGTNVSFHPHIKGKCQMPYEGPGGGYLIGIESFDNPDQSYSYEMLVLDCTLLAEGKDAWIYTTGKCGVTEGNALWTIWQPQYGYYWTLFRVYDKNDILIDQECYGFVNAY